LPHSAISEQTTKYPETLAKQGISRHKGAKHNYDKNTFYLPRQIDAKATDVKYLQGFLTPDRINFPHFSHTFEPLFIARYISFAINRGRDKKWLKNHGIVI
jgi:pantothenate kinase